MTADPDAQQRAEIQELRREFAREREELARIRSSHMEDAFLGKAIRFAGLAASGVGLVIVVFALIAIAVQVLF